MKCLTTITKEYKKVCEAMDDVLQNGGGRTPLPEDNDLYCRLAVVKKTLEWVHSMLIPTTTKGRDRSNELMGHRHIAKGPTHAVLYPKPFPWSNPTARVEKVRNTTSDTDQAGSRP